MSGGDRRLWCALRRMTGLLKEAVQEIQEALKATGGPGEAAA
jgi:hypothetical protein